MSQSLRIRLMLFAIFGAISTLSAQSTTADELRRADKQFDFYAYNLAMKTYQEVVKKEPTNAHALAKIGDCLTQLNRPDEAITWYDRATSQNDVKPEVLLNYGKALMATGNYTSAKKWFKFYAENNKEEGDHYSELCDYAIFNAGKDALYQAKIEAMNSAASDFSPVFYGKRIIFNSSRTDISRSKKGGKESADWSGNNYNQLFATQIDAGGNLQKPAFFKSDLANAFNEGPISFSGDGSRVAFCRNNFVDGSRQIAKSGITMSLYTADVVDGQWTNVKAFEFNGSDYATGFPNLSPDGNTLFFASNHPDGEGGWDIYSSNWTGKYWTTPKNAGKSINTKGNEITPFFDGKNLYFSSDYSLGLGGLDVFRAEKEDAGWSKIFHLGPGINSSRDDYGFVFNATENIGYLTSNRPGGKGNEDVWQIRKKTDDFVITVLDDAKKPVAEAVVDFTNCKGGEFTTDSKGQYSFSVTAGAANCKATVRKKGYRDAIAEVKSSGLKTIQVMLEADNIGKFNGLVYDTRTREGLADVSVRALPMPSGEVVSAKTNKSGEYALTLEAKRTYKLQYSKDGYADTMMTLETGAAKSSNDISPVLLQDAATVLAEAKKDKTGASAPVTYDAQPKKSTSKEAPAPEKPSESPVLKMLQEDVKTVKGWSIQLASVPGTTISEARLAKYDGLRSQGNIYTTPGVKTLKVRLGVYERKSDAEAILKEVKKKYPSAFLAEEKNAQDGLLVNIKPVESSTTSKPDKAKTGSGSGKTPVRYAVQLASLSTDESINLAPYMKITDLGNVYTRPENDLTKIRVGVWENSDEADAAQAQIVKRGFKDAVVVTEKSIAATERFLIKAKKDSEKTTQFLPKTEPKGGTDKQKSIVRPIQHSIEPPAAAQKSPVYKVRVATYETESNFDKSELEGIEGKLEKRREGKKTVFLLGGYTDLESALNAKNEVREAGFSDAHVVKEEKGKLIKVKL